MKMKHDYPSVSLSPRCAATGQAGAGIPNTFRYGTIKFQPRDPDYHFTATPLFPASSFELYRQLLLKGGYDNLGRGLDGQFGGVDGHVMVQRISRVSTELATGQPRSFAIRTFDLHPRCLQAQVFTAGDPSESHLDRCNHPHPQTELTGQNVLCSAADDDHVSLVTQREKNLPQVSQVAGCSNGLRVEPLANRILNCRPIALIHALE
jgi:hypothetical protein